MPSQQRVRLCLIALVISLTACSQGASTTTTEFVPPLETTTSSSTTTTEYYNPHEGRPHLARFGFVRGHSEALDTYCNENFGRPNQGAACYDAIKRQKGAEFESWLEEAEQSILKQLGANSPSYSADQYGCHSDGRCLDQYGVWCDEADVIFMQDDFGNEWLECT